MRHIRVSLGLTFAYALSMLLIVTTVWAANQPSGQPMAPQQNTRGVYIKSHRVSVTIDNQIATTKIEQVFVNEGQGLAEGTYLFPLPAGAAVSDLTLTINGQSFKAQILPATQAQAIYTEIVRRKRDPVLLQYIGRDAIQANIFPIPAGEQRKIEITYSSVVNGDSGLFSYLYPLKTDYASPLPVEQVSVSVSVTSKDPISTVYSPNPLVSINRSDDKSFRAGFETTNYRATDDFNLYYGVANKDISANLLTYRASATEDGYFMLMLTPPTKAAADRIIPKDVIIVLDQSGSMYGPKWDQARAAASYVLKHLNEQDRFNALVFSTGYRLYAKKLQPVAEAPKAVDWINQQEALGGTDINAALMAALEMTDKDRQTTLLFMTDGLPTDGVTDISQILANVHKAATPNLRVFAFGVGDDVNPFLLDSLSSAYGGVSVYVRPKDNIEQQMSSLYNKITSPVLTAIKLDFGDAVVDDMYPSAPLPDLFAGSQLIVVGRFRNKASATITLTGQLDGKPQTYVYSNLQFPENAGGQSFIPRLWATRKIGALLNQIRLTGQKQELVDSVVRLSIRYGIITPYTSYLIQENDINAQREGAGGNTAGQATFSPPGTAAPSIMILPTPMPFALTSVAPSSNASGAPAIDQAKQANELQGAQVAAQPTTITTDKAGDSKDVGTGHTNEPIKQVNDRTFFLRNGVWVDAQYTSDSKLKLVPVTFLSDEYFKLLADHPEIKDYLAIGDHVIIVIDTTAYEIKPQ